MSTCFALLLVSLHELPNFYSHPGQCHVCPGVLTSPPSRAVLTRIRPRVADAQESRCPGNSRATLGPRRWFEPFPDLPTRSSGWGSRDLEGASLRGSCSTTPPAGVVVTSVASKGQVPRLDRLRERVLLSLQSMARFLRLCTWLLALSPGLLATVRAECSQDCATCSYRLVRPGDINFLVSVSRLDRGNKWVRQSTSIPGLIARCVSSLHAV